MARMALDAIAKKAKNVIERESVVAVVRGVQILSLVLTLEVGVRQAQPPAAWVCGHGSHAHARCTELRPMPLEAEMAEGHLEFDLLDDRGNRITDVSWIQTRLWMPQFDHGSYPTETRQSQSGHFVVDSMEFSRPGQWQLLVDFLTSRSAGALVINLPRVVEAN